MTSDDERSVRLGESRFRWSASSGRAGAKDIARRIREAVTIGALKPGDKLPGEHELAASFDVARGTVPVLTTGGPDVALVLGQETPRIEVWWGGHHGTTHVNLHEAAVDAFVET